MMYTEAILFVLVQQKKLDAAFSRWFPESILFVVRKIKPSELRNILDDNID